MSVAIQSFVVDTLQTTNKKIDRLRTAWSSSRYPDVIESAHLPGSLIYPGDGTFWVKSGKFFDQRTYQIRVLAGELGEKVFAQAQVDAFYLLGGFSHTYLSIFADDPNIAYEPYRITVMNVNSRDGLRDSGIVPRLPNVPPIVYNDFKEYIGFDLFLEILAEWNTDC